MKKYLLLIINALVIVSFTAQENVEWEKVNDYAVSYKLPETWASDPFSSSSVCDCPGTINDNGNFDSEYIGMVIYPCESIERLDENRSQVWGYEFVSEGPEQKVKYAGIEYKLELGSFDGMSGDPIVWRLYSIGSAGKDKKQLVVYFWGGSDVFQDNIDSFKEILESFKRKKI